MPTVTIRSTLGRVGAALAALAATWAVAWLWLAGSPRDALAATGWALLLAVAVWSLWWAPAITLSRASLVVRNAWRTHVVSWQALEGCRVTWSLEVLLGDGARLRTSAAPRPGGMAVSWRQRQGLQARALAGKGGSSPGPAHRLVDQRLITPGKGHHRVSLDSFGAADLIEAYAEQRLVNESLRPSQDQAVASATAVTSSWRATPFAALALAAVCLLLSTLL